MNAPIHQTRPPSKILDPEGPLMLCAPDVRQAHSAVEALHASLPALRGFMPFAHLNQTVDVQYTRLAQLTATYWTGKDYGLHLYDPAEPEVFLGSVGLHRRAMNPDALEIGYWVRTDRAGRGLCTRAARMAVVLCIEHFGCQRVQCGYDVANHASARVAEKAGFAVEGDLVGYGPRGTEAMRANGWLAAGVNRMAALDPARARAQPWYAPMVARLRWWDWMGREVRPR